MARNKKASQYQELSLFDSNGEALFSARPAGAAEADAFKPVLDKWERLLSEAGGKVRLSYPTVDREKRMAGLLYDTKPTRLFITEGLPEGKDGSTRTEYGLRIDGTPGTDKYKEAENLLDVYNSVSSLHNKGYEHEGRQESAFYFYSVEAAMTFSLFADFSRNKGKEAERKNTKDSKKTIHDVGPKVYGARKDLYAEMVERVQRNAALPSEDLDEKIKNTPKAKLFDFDLDRLVKMGYPNSAVSYIKIMKDYARPKPKTSYSWKLQEWFFDTRFLYKQCLKAFLHPESIPGFFDSAGEYDPDIKDVHYGYNAYMAVGGYKSGRSIGDAILYRLSDGTVGWSADGKRREDNGGKWRLSRAGSHGDVYDTFDEAAAQLLEYTVELQKKEEMKKEARKKPKDAVICCWHNSQSTAGYWLAPKKFSDIILAEGFKTKKEAFAYGREHYAELQDKYRRIRAAGEVYYHENRPRTGKDWRKGKDVSPEEFKKMFGFKALVFGNYVTQKEGQVLLNDSYDAFMDFTDALGLPPEAVSLGGKMEFGIGSHGKGGRSGAAAKFIYNDDKKEPIIAITKNDGPGTLGHELFHAIDCYSAYRWEKRGYATNGDGRHPGTQRDFHLNADGTCRYKGKDYGKDDTDRLLTGYPSERNITYAWQQLAEALTKPGSDYYRRAKVYDELHPRMKDGKNTHYYIQPTELGARAFSTWMENRLKEKGCRNDFLCNNPEIEEDKLNEEQRKYIYYPFGEDNERLKEPFDNLIRTMKAKYEKERPILYQMGSQPKMNDYGAEARKLATEFVMERLKNAGVDVRIATDEEAKAAAKGKADTIYGWQEGNRVCLTKDGINPETPIHEYTHLWARAMMVKNPEGWKNVKDLLRDTPVWNGVIKDKNYGNIRDDENEVASEALSRLSGVKNAAGLQNWIEENCKDASRGNPVNKGVIDRIVEALRQFWSWVGKELFGIRSFKDIDEVTDRVMYDLVNGTDITLGTDDQRKDRLYERYVREGNTELAKRMLSNRAAAKGYMEQDYSGKDARSLLRDAEGMDRNRKIVSVTGNMDKEIMGVAEDYGLYLETNEGKELDMEKAKGKDGVIIYVLMEDDVRQTIRNNLSKGKAAMDAALDGRYAAEIKNPDNIDMMTEDNPAGKYARALYDSPRWLVTGSTVSANVNAWRKLGENEVLALIKERGFTAAEFRDGLDTHSEAAAHLFKKNKDRLFHEFLASEKRKIAARLGEGFSWHASDTGYHGDAVRYRYTGECYDIDRAYSKAVTGLTVSGGELHIEVSDLEEKRVACDAQRNADRGLSDEESLILPGNRYINPHELDESGKDDLYPEEWDGLRNSLLNAYIERLSGGHRTAGRERVAALPASTDGERRRVYVDGTEQDTTDDDDMDAPMQGRKKEDLLSENGNGLDPDGDGVSNIIQDLVGDSNGEAETEKKQDETRQHRHEESHLRR